MGSIGVVPRVELFERDWCLVFFWLDLDLTQPGIDVLGGLLAVADAGGDGAIAFDHIATGEDARVAGHHVAIDIHHTALDVEVHIVAEQTEINFLTEGKD